MDRFIGNYNYIPDIPKYTLKSNMDRFIVPSNEKSKFELFFKIQYG